MKQFTPKKATYFWKVSLLLLFFCCTCGAFASKIKVIDGLKYMLDTETNEATLIAYNYSGRIDVPEKVTFEGTTYPVVAFDAECFKGCSELKSIKIPNSVKELGEECFNSTGLTQIDLPESIEKLGESCFSRSFNLEKVTLPSSINEISKNCFSECQSLKDITIPASVTKLGNGCFLYTAIESIIIPSSIKEIPDGCFYCCSSLENIQLPESVTSLGSRSFCGTGFTNFEIPSSIKSIGAECFSSSDKLKSITIPTSIDSLPNGCFSFCKKIESIDLPSSIKSIGDNCFANCEILASFTIPETVGSIGKECFYGCSNLSIFKSLAIAPPSTQANTFSGLDSCTLYVPKDAIDNYKSISSWNVFKGISSLDDLPQTKYITINNLKYTYDTTNLTACLVANDYSGDITVPGKITVEEQEYIVTSFAKNCFKDCEDLTQISIPNSITTLGENCFYGCKKLAQINIPNSVTTLGTNCFMNCENLTDIVLPESIISLDGSFNGCKSLSLISIPNSITTLGGNCFRGCENLAQIIIPNSVKSLGSSCFSGCSKLTSITIPSSVTSLDAGCFSGCSALKDITLPSNLESISNSCFSGCTSLQAISIPEGVRTLGFDSFFDCENLTSITLPSTLTNIFLNSFNGNHLREIRCNSRKVPDATWGDGDNWDVFAASACILYVRPELVNDFKSSPNWKSFKFIFALDETPTASFQEIEGVEYVIDSQNKEAIVASLKKDNTSITIPTAVTFNNEEYPVIALADRCFYSKHFYTIDLPSSIATIGKECFGNCGNLYKIKILDPIKIIPNLCFNSCYNLQEVELPASVDSIGKWSFIGCQYLENINLPEGIKTIAHQAFAGVSLLKHLALPSSTKTVYVSGLPTTSLEELNCFAIEPPIIKGTINDDFAKNCILYVPEESLDKYKQTNGWKNFYDIQPIKSTGIKNSKTENITSSVNDGLLTITGLKDKEKVFIYNTNGVHLASIYAQGGTVNYPLAANDIVIVKCGKKSFKIAR